MLPLNSHDFQTNGWPLDADQQSHLFFAAFPADLAIELGKDARCSALSRHDELKVVNNLIDVYNIVIEKNNDETAKRILS